MCTVLLLGSGTQSLAIIPGLHKEGHKIVMITGEHSNYGDRSKYVEKVFRVGKVSDVEYVNLLNKIVLNESVDVIIPMGDDTALLLSKFKDEIKNASFKSPDYSVFMLGYDKNNLMDLCRVGNYPHPYTVDLSKVSIKDAIITGFPFPAMLKPNCTTGGRGMAVIRNYNELVLKYPSLHKEYGEYHLQKFIKPGGKQVKVQLYLNEEKKLLAYSVQQKLRWYPNNAGSNSCAVSVNNDAIVVMCYNVLCDIGWTGFADFDTIEDPDTGQLLIMEINPRLPACIKGSVKAGVDWGKIIVNDALNLEIPQVHYKTGVFLRHLGLEILWFIHAQNRFSIKPNWFHFIGRDIYYQDMNGWADLLPFFTGTFQNILKLFNPSFRKAKGRV